MKLSSSQRDQIVEDYLAGSTQAKLALKYEISIGHVSRVLRARGIGQFAFSAEEIAQIVADYNSGCSLLDLIKKYRRSLYLLKDVLSVQGIAIREEKPLKRTRQRGDKTEGRKCLNCSIVLSDVTCPRQYGARRKALCVQCEQDYRPHAHLLKKYRITLREYQQLLERSGNQCEICGARPQARRLHIDHCHTSGRVRGLLCALCNAAIGMMGENIQKLQGAINYLTTHSTEHSS